MGFLRDLKNDVRGNVLIMTAASLLPLAGVIGGGLDMSRVYLVNSRVQQACDAATLAARRQMGGAIIEDGRVPPDIRDTADNFFENNFREGVYGSFDQEFEIEAGSEIRLDGTASAKVPMTLMYIFGVEEFEVEVNCSSELNLPNIDVMLVLDMSGSMDGQPIRDLQASVREFYDEVMSVAPEEARIRMGFMPYSAAVNVGSILHAENPSFLVNEYTYQSRELTWQAYDSTYSLIPRDKSDLGSGSNSDYRWNKNSNSQRNTCENYAGTYNVGNEYWVISGPWWIPDYWTSYSNNQRAGCGALVTKHRRVFEYKPRVFDTRAFKTGAEVNTPSDTSPRLSRSRWNGCIEEREMVASTDYSSIPEGALDLDIDLVPTASDPRTQWRPMWPEVNYNRGRSAPVVTTTDGGSMENRFSCPSPAVRLTEFPLDGGNRHPDFERAVNSLRPQGATLHDIGMIWGARFLSPTGIFADDNREAPNGEPIARHIIFMTDGQMAPTPTYTDSYGNYDMDERFAGRAPDGTWSQGQLTDIHNQRFTAICRRVRNTNITIWVVSFNFDLNDNTRGCASGPNRAFEAEDAEELTSAFRRIATSIAELRLVD